jgi:ketosteroid isomerase-like protein
MSQENVEIVRAMWAAWAIGDYDASLGAFAEDTVWDDTRFRPDGAVHHGQDALADLARAWREAWEHYDIEVEVLDAGDDSVAAVLHETAEGVGGGVAVTNRWGIVATVRAGKIVHTMVYPTPEEVLEAVGLREWAWRFLLVVSPDPPRPAARRQGGRRRRGARQRGRRRARCTHV